MKIKLNLGCGKNNIPGFINIDLDNLSHVHHVSDIRKLDFIEDQTVDLIYCSHSLEYFDRDEVKNVLINWKSKLKKGGILRLAVPDFEAICKVYLKYKDLDHRGILGPLYGRWPLASDKDEIFYHKSTYDFESLKKIIMNLGFSDYYRYNWEDTIHKNYDDYSQAYIPHMDKKNGILISLNIEAIK